MLSTFVLYGIDMDFGKISDLQLKYIEGLDCSELSPVDKVKFGRVLISNYKKAKQILKSRVDLAGDWDTILVVAKQGLDAIVESIKSDVFHEDDIKPGTKIAYVELLMNIQFLDFEDEVYYKHVEGGLEEEVDLNLFDDYT